MVQQDSLKTSTDELSLRRLIPHSLKKRISEWRKLKGISQVVLAWIEEGVALPFQRVPIPKIFNNKNIPYLESQFITQEVKRMLDCGAILQLNEPPLICSPIHAVPKKNGKFRLVIDMRYLNSHLVVPKFKMEGLDTLSKMVEADDYMFTVDLQDGYYHINMHKSAIRYLGFQWQGNYYTYKVLPFGLAISPLVFSKIMHSIVSHLRQLGHRILVYLDDFIGLTRNKSMVLKKVFLKLLRNLGLHISLEKSSLNLEQEKEFLGLLVRTINRLMFHVPHKKKVEVAKEISRMLKRRMEPLPARRVARVAGLCISLSKAVGPTRLLMRNLFKDLNQKSNWEAKVLLSEEAINDLIWWKEVMESWDGKFVIPSRADVTIYTDASNSGWGGALEGKSARGFWTPAMMNESINYREMMAAFMTILAFKEDLRNKVVLLRTDNISTVAYINKMTGQSDPLYNLGRAIANLSKELNIELMAQHIPGVENITADRLSRMMDKNDWKLHPRYFKLIEMKW